MFALMLCLYSTAGTFSFVLMCTPSTKKAIKQQQQSVALIMCLNNYFTDERVDLGHTLNFDDS